MFRDQVSPPLVDTLKLYWAETMAKTWPSPEDVTEFHKHPSPDNCVQLRPPSEEMNGAQQLTAANLEPSAAVATLCQFVAGAVVGAQVTPKLVETYMNPPSTEATSVLPSAEEATHDQLVLGALVRLQFWAGALVDAIWTPSRMASKSPGREGRAV